MEVFRRIISCGWIALVALIVFPTQTLFAWQSASECPHETMRQVNDYWIGKYPGSGTSGWRPAVYQMGNLAAYHATDDVDYLAYARNWAKKNAWKMGTAAQYADNLACGQVYLELFDLDPTPIPPAPIAGVRASADDGNKPENTLDNKLTTRWSAAGDGQWIEFDLGAPTVITHVSIGWYLGNQRKSKFTIEVSNNRESWTQVFPLGGASEGLSREKTTAQQAFDFPDVTARYVRYVGHGNDSVDKPLWNSLNEVDIHTPSDPRLASIKGGVDVQLYRPEVKDWSWIDAMFMEAPVLSRLCDLYQDTAYCAKLYALYRHTKTSAGPKDPQNPTKNLGLYDTTTKLWYQRAAFVAPKTLWSRGNGWVIAAHVRILEYLPLDDPHRNEYITILKNMAAALKARQRTDGFWNVSLPAPGAPETFPGPETSGTALITYAMARGINQGYLNRSTYTPVVLKAWDGMVRDAVHPDGKLGYVQGVGGQPSDAQPINYDNTAIPHTQPPGHGVGPFLLAGSEVAKLQEVTFSTSCNQ